MVASDKPEGRLTAGSKEIFAERLGPASVTHCVTL